MLGYLTIAIHFQILKRLEINFRLSAVRLLVYWCDVSSVGPVGAGVYLLAAPPPHHGDGRVSPGVADQHPRPAHHAAAVQVRHLEVDGNCNKRQGSGEIIEM